MTDRSDMLTIEIQNAFPFARWRVSVTSRAGVHIRVQSITDSKGMNIHDFDGFTTSTWAVLTADQMISELDHWFTRGAVPRWLLNAQRAHNAREEAAALARLIRSAKSKKKDKRL